MSVAWYAWDGRRAVGPMTLDELNKITSHGGLSAGAAVSSSCWMGAWWKSLDLVKRRRGILLTMACVALLSAGVGAATSAFVLTRQRDSDARAAMPPRENHETLKAAATARPAQQVVERRGPMTRELTRQELETFIQVRVVSQSVQAQQVRLRNLTDHPLENIHIATTFKEKGVDFSSHDIALLGPGQLSGPYNLVFIGDCEFSMRASVLDAPDSPTRIIYAKQWP